MNDFETATLRLKQVLGVKLDRDVAAQLGLSPRAWAGRKKSGLFPETELFALLAKRPDLRIDVHYVLTGERATGPAADALQRMHQLSVSLPPELQRLAVEASAKHASTAEADHDFLAKIKALLPWCDEDARDLMLRLAQYGSRRKN